MERERTRGWIASRSGRNTGPTGDDRWCGMAPKHLNLERGAGIAITPNRSCDEFAIVAGLNLKRLPFLPLGAALVGGVGHARPPAGYVLGGHRATE